MRFCQINTKLEEKKAKITLDQALPQVPDTCRVPEGRKGPLGRADRENTSKEKKRGKNIYIKIYLRQHS